MLAVIAVGDETGSARSASRPTQRARPVASCSRWRAVTPSCADVTSRASRWRCRVEFSSQDHRITRELENVQAALVKRLVRLINAGRRDGSLPPGPPARAVALALIGALEGAVIALAGQAPHDEVLAVRAVAGVLGLDGPPTPSAA